MRISAAAIDTSTAKAAATATLAREQASFRLVMASTIVQDVPQARSTSRRNVPTAAEEVTEGRSVSETDTPPLTATAVEPATPSATNTAGQTESEGVAATTSEVMQPIPSQAAVGDGGAVQIAKTPMVKQGIPLVVDSPALTVETAEDAKPRSVASGSTAKTTGKQRQVKMRGQSSEARRATVTVAVPFKGDPAKAAHLGGSMRDSSNDYAAEEAKHDNVKAKDTPRAVLTNDVHGDSPSPALASDRQDVVSGDVPIAEMQVLDIQAFAPTAESTNEMSDVTAPVETAEITGSVWAAAMDSTATMKGVDVESTAKSAPVAAVDPAVHLSGSTSQAQQGDPSKLVVELKESTDGTGPLLNNVSPQAATRDSVASQHGLTASETSLSATKALDRMDSIKAAGEEEPRAAGINIARLVQTMGETEMHVGMHSEEFGNISIRTAISQQQMVTQISLDHNDLSQAITNHVAGVQTKLHEEYGFQASIQVSNQGMMFSGEKDGPSQGESRRKSPATPSRVTESLVVADVAVSGGSGVAYTDAGGLDIRV